MSRAHVYRTLVPDAPLYRRTDRDTFQTLEFARRVDATNFLRERAARVGLQSPKLISSFAGSIDSLLFVFPQYLVNDPRHAYAPPAYQSLIRELRPGTRFVIAHHETIKAEFESWFTAAGHSSANLTWVPIPNFASLTDWAEDAYVALEDATDGATYLMEPWEFPRGGDALIADAVEQFTNLTASQAPSFSREATVSSVTTSGCWARTTSPTAYNSRSANARR